MIDTVQLVLFFIVVVLTILLIVLGVQVYFILRELRQTVIKMNKVLDDTSAITESVSGPISSISSLASGVKASTVFTVAKVIKGLLSKDSDTSAKKKERGESDERE